MPHHARTGGALAPGTEGVIDLYLMPAYDDIASIYYSGDRWNLHYLFPDTKNGAPRARGRDLSTDKGGFGEDP